MARVILLPARAGKATRRLLHFSVVAFLSACAVAAIKASSSELRFLLQVCLGWIRDDSAYYMNQAWAVSKLGKPLYQELFFRRHEKFIYPTSSLLTYVVADSLHVSGTALIKYLVLLSLAATLVVAGEIFVLVSPSREGAQQSRLYDRLLVAFLGLLFYPLVCGAAMGQVQTLMTFGWTLAVYFWIKGRKELTGVSLGLTCVFKPMLAVFLVWGLLRREWRFAGAFLASLLVLQTMAVAKFGWRDEIDYLTVLSYLSHHGEALIANQSVNGLLQRVFRNGSLSWSETQYPPFSRAVYLGTTVSSLLFFCFGLFYPMFKKMQDRTRDLLIFGLVSTIASPIAWEHHYGYFYVASIYFLATNMNMVTRSFYVFTASFVIMANSLRFLEPLATTPLTLLLSYDLYAGIAIILLLSSSATEWLKLPVDVSRHAIDVDRRAGELVSPSSGLAGHSRQGTA